MRKPASGRLSGAGLSKTETAQCGLPFLPDPAPDNQVTQSPAPAEAGLILIAGGKPWAPAS